MTVRPLPKLGPLALLLSLTACAAEPALPDLEEIYTRVDQADGGSVAIPLITVPGTLGSRLRDRESGTVVWGGGSRGLSADPDDPVEARLIALPIPLEDVPVSALSDGIEPFGVLDTATAEIFGIPIDLEVYGGVQRTLTLGGFRSETRSATLVGAGRGDDLVARADVPGAAAEDLIAQPPPRAARTPTVEDYRRLGMDQANAFRFDYDWRRDIPALVREFHAFVEMRKRQLAAVRSLTEGRTVQPEEIRFDLLAHSMGGLIARYYLMHGAAPLADSGELPPITWAGARNFDRAVFVATPNAGSILAMDNLINGKELGPLQPFYPAALLATHASVWQLFPRGRHNRVAGSDGTQIDPLDPDVWERFEWGMADPAAAPILDVLMPDTPDPAARKVAAVRHQARLIERARRFHAAMDRWAPKPPDLELYLVVGGGFATAASATVDPDGTFRISGREEGDGVVLRASVLLDERQGGAATGGLRTPLRFDTTLFLPDEHVELTKNPVFGDNLLFWLLEQPRDVATLAEPTEGLLGSIADPAAADDRAGRQRRPDPGNDR